ncbi:glycoside hydrolase family 1 protein [Karstenula rhodostoma CBS 690.94]|uniref:Glycoside hydrolase family 1 protein n=1 Tax=Karstenula rhodostoma CBS 690.94 TaxID=1392251 RepID=A0A9P4PH58_9PLEO|nr:glycoside hydrolase family 1 protein [Karstenula rhodostoma CBS 690.94]
MVVACQWMIPCACVPSSPQTVSHPYVGPISTFSINATVQPAPIPSSSVILPLPLYYPSLPTGQQVPLRAKNESWKFPKNFWYSDAGAAYQIEVAAKAESRVPSIWDVLSHRVPSYVVTNETGDVANNNYYQYKEGTVRLQCPDKSLSTVCCPTMSNAILKKIGLKEYVETFLDPFTDDQKAQTNITHMTLTSDFMTAKLRRTYANGYWLIGPAVDPGSGEPYEALRNDLPSIFMKPLRSAYYRDYLEVILKAISEGVNVGYSVKFGIQYVNLTTQERFFKASAFEYVNAFNVYLDQ